MVTSGLKGITRMTSPRKPKPGSTTDAPRTHLVKVYVTEREQTQIRLAASSANLSMTEFCRQALKEKAKAAIKAIANLQDD